MAAAGAHAEGTLVLVGGEDGGRWIGGMERQLGALAISPFVRQRLPMSSTRERHQELGILADLIETGKVTPVIDRTYPLREAPEAIRRLEAGSVRGKIVITL